MKLMDQVSAVAIVIQQPSSFSFYYTPSDCDSLTLKKLLKMAVK